MISVDAFFDELEKISGIIAPEAPELIGNGLGQLASKVLQPKVLLPYAAGAGTVLGANALQNEWQKYQMGRQMTQGQSMF